MLAAPLMNRSHLPAWVMQVAIYNSKKKYRLYLLGSLAFTALGIILLLVGPILGQPLQVWRSWAIIAVFSGMSVIFMWRLFDVRPRIVIDEEGIADRHLSVGRIPWSEIRDAFLISAHFTQWICLDLFHEQKYLQRMSFLRRAFNMNHHRAGLPPCSLYLSGLDVDAQELLRVIQEMAHNASANLKSKE